MRTGLALLVAVLGLTVVGTARAQAPGLERALSGYDESMRPVEGLVVRADFDADGDVDVAAVTTDGTRRSFLVIEAGEGEWRVHPLFARLPDTDVRLRIVPPGRHRVLGPRGAVELTSPAVELVFPERSSAMYVWDGGRWHVHATENY